MKNCRNWANHGSCEHVAHRFESGSSRILFRLARFEADLRGERPPRAHQRPGRDSGGRLLCGWREDGSSEGSCTRGGQRHGRSLGRGFRGLRSSPCVWRLGPASPLITDANTNGRVATRHPLNGCQAAHQTPGTLLVAECTDKSDTRPSIGRDSGAYNETSGRVRVEPGRRSAWERSVTRP